MASDSRLNLGTRFCKCSACGQYFGGIGGFDMHRVGHWERRLCLDPAAVVGRAGNRKLWLNERGYWVTDYPETVSEKRVEA